MRFFRSLLHAGLLAVAAPSALCAEPPRNPPEAPAGFVGESKQSAIEVCNPAGERAYLSRLVCSGGESPTYKRMGSFGGRNEFPKNLSAEQTSVLVQRVISGAPLQPGEPDYHVIDGYEVICGEVKRVVYLDMYHCDQAPPTVAPRGFTLRPAE